MPNRYPLARLAEIRALRATGAAVDLAEALAGERDAEAEVAEARAAVEAARVAARAATLVADAAGASSAMWAVVQREAYAIRLRRDVERAIARVTAREAELAEWRATVAQARETMISTRADQKVVERHREQWEDAAKKKRERRED
ncbi:MAG TPA: hypothetical protein VM261_07255 [Kofleriaceae bacterium]|nr:hypothetical protein [Kofleriaceae bacterium]